MATDNANVAPPPEQSCPHIVKNNQPRLHVYPRWFLLKWHNLVTVALKTRDVELVALKNMLSAGKLCVVPQWAEKVVRSIDNLIWMDNSHAITLVTTFATLPIRSRIVTLSMRIACTILCKSFLSRYSSAYDQLEFADEAHLFVADMKAAGCFERPFHVTLLTILQWCDHK
jgi:hypothetical protein